MIKQTKKMILFLSLIFLGIYSSASAEVVDRIVALVNNDIITLVQLNKAIHPYKINIETSQKSSQEQKQLIEKLKTDMLQQLIDRSLTAQEADKYQVKVSEADVDAAVENFKKMNKLDQAGLEKALAAEGLAYKDYRARMKEEILQSMLITRAVRSKVIITDNDIKAYYESHKDEFVGVKKYHLRNILMETEADILAVEAKLSQGLSFAQLAKDHSLATNASEGGDLGVFDVNSFSETIKNELLQLGKGQHSKVLETGQGYQLIYVEDILLEGDIPFDQARDQIQNILYKEQAEKRFSDWIESLKKSAHIKEML